MTIGWVRRQLDGYFAYNGYRDKRTIDQFVEWLERTYKQDLDKHKATKKGLHGHNHTPTN